MEQFSLFFGSPPTRTILVHAWGFKQLPVFGVAVVWYFEKRLWVRSQLCPMP